MKTPLQQELAVICPNISIETIWEHDPDHEGEFKSLSKNPGDCFYGEDWNGWERWQSEIRATAIVAGEQVSGSAYLCGTWERLGDHPSVSNPDISGYEPDMIIKALEELAKQCVSIEIQCQIAAAIARCSSALNLTNLK
jgi:hypothetical protein